MIVDDKQKVKEMNELVKENSKCKSLWASTECHMIVTAQKLIQI